MVAICVVYSDNKSEAVEAPETSGALLNVQLHLTAYF